MGKRGGGTDKRHQRNRHNNLEKHKEACHKEKGPAIPVQNDSQCLHDWLQMEQHTRIRGKSELPHVQRNRVNATHPYRLLLHRTPPSLGKSKGTVATWTAGMA